MKCLKVSTKIITLNYLSCISKQQFRHFCFLWLIKSLQRVFFPIVWYFQRHKEITLPWVQRALWNCGKNKIDQIMVHGCKSHLKLDVFDDRSNGIYVIRYIYLVIWVIIYLSVFRYILVNFKESFLFFLRMSKQKLKFGKLLHMKVCSNIHLINWMFWINSRKSEIMERFLYFIVKPALFIFFNF